MVNTGASGGQGNQRGDQSLGQQRVTGHSEQCGFLSSNYCKKCGLQKSHRLALAAHILQKSRNSLVDILIVPTQIQQSLILSHICFLYINIYFLPSYLKINSRHNTLSLNTLATSPKNKGIFSYITSNALSYLGKVIIS